MESIRKSPVENSLINRCDGLVGALGYRVVDLDCHVGPRSQFRLFLDRKESGLGVSFDDCVTVTKVLGDFLDSGEVFPGPYELEVSSPGLDRRLRTLADFEKSVGQTLKLKLWESHEGVGANCTGRLLAVVPTGNSAENRILEIEISGVLHKISLSEIKRANLVWSPGTQINKTSGEQNKRQKKGSKGR